VKIVLRESEGLGNQLFQYAALRYYAKRYGAEIRIAVHPDAMCNGYPRPCQLQHFSIQAPMGERSVWDRFLCTDNPWLKAASDLLRKVLRIQKCNEQVKDRFCFLRDLPLQPAVKTLYMWGYFQTYLMVEAVADELRLDLRFGQAASGKTLEVLNQIRSSKHAVSLHVRRGDSVLPAEGKVVLPMEYYSDAISLFQQRLADPTFFVFSDDLPFAKENLPCDPKVVFVGHNDIFTAHEDLRLMSACQHHIIANSTFSWWGAWLSSQPDKMVIAPRKWYVGKDSDNPNLCPPDWMLAEIETAERHFA
jgi:Glycosyl transferase family 11